VECALGTKEKSKLENICIEISNVCTYGGDFLISDTNF